MTSPDNILLHLEKDEEQQVREIFALLEQQGFPAQQQTPHITITFSPSMAGDVVKRATELLPPVIPASFQRVGTVVFGTKRKQTVAWLLETSDEMEIAARHISALNPAGRGPRWTPHLTMGLRLPREIVPDYIRALDEVTSPHLKELTAVRAVFWRPRTQGLTVLAKASLADEAGPGPKDEPADPLP
ncbi:2',5' RNA ligase family [Corynebacterium occultum]|uniref:2',5' RNA ligase family n=1 Tax=Corynebacterium occultum TaxID=2675219 RepID=A0A6B8VN20_9CORY|nr:2'-5' RNA ligase family protein [Corynebacterium occultum]QGU06902.1 2',5' RNA ligase family [Corynebacterium occultum]